MNNCHGTPGRYETFKLILEFIINKQHYKMWSKILITRIPHKEPTKCIVNVYTHTPTHNGVVCECVGVKKT